MSTTELSTRRQGESTPKGGRLQQLPRENGYKLPEYLEMVEVNALIAAAPNPKARLIMLEQWRAGLWVSEALALEARDLHLDSDRPTLVVRQGKGRKDRVVPVLSEGNYILDFALTALPFFHILPPRQSNATPNYHVNHCKEAFMPP